MELNGCAHGKDVEELPGGCRENSRSRSPHKTSTDTQRWLRIIENDWQMLQQAPADFRGNPDLICEAMRISNGAALAYASDELRGDKEYVLGAAQEIGPGVIEHASDELRGDREFMLEVVDYCPPTEVLQYLTEELRADLLKDHEFMLQAVQDAGAEVLEHAPVELRGDRDFILSVADHCPPGEALQYATAELRDELCGDRSFMLQAVQAIGAEVLEDASLELRADRAFMAEVLKHCPASEALEYASEELRAEFTGGNGSHDAGFASGGCAAAYGVTAKAPGGGYLASTQRKSAPALPPPMHPFPGSPLAGVPMEALEPVPPPPSHAAMPALPLPVHTPMPAAAAVPQLPVPVALAPVPKLPVPVPTPPVSLPGQSLHVQGARILQAVREMGSQALEYASLDLRNDRDFILAAAACCPAQEAFRYASDRVKVLLGEDRNFVLKLVRELGAAALEHASMELRGDRDFMLAAAGCCPPREALSYASDKLRMELCADRAFMLKAVWQVGTPALEHAAPQLRADREFMFTAANYCPVKDVLRFSNEEVRTMLQADRAFMLRALREMGPTVLETAADSLRQDREFILAAAGCCPPREALRFAVEDLRVELSDDKSFMLRAVWEVGAQALAQASEALRGDREFVMAAAAWSPNEALKHCSAEVRGELSADAAFMLKAVKEVGAKALEHAAEALRSDLGFMISVSTCCPPGEAMKYAAESLREELDEDDD